MKVTKISQMIEYAKTKSKKHLVVAYGQDGHSIDAVSKAIDIGFVSATLVGDRDVIEQYCQKNDVDIDKFTIVDVKDEVKSGAKSVELINDGKGDMIMKGLIGTGKYMKAILNKQNGLLKPGGILTHVAVIQPPSYHKLLIISDAAILPNPNIEQKIKICNFLIKAGHGLGIQKPKVAAVCLSEKVNPRLQQTIDASILSKMSERGQIKNAIVDGPMALDLAVDMETVKIKGFKSEVGGDADCLLFDNIEAGNVLYKSMTKLANAQLAAILVGASVPAILSSRGDSTETKLNSIALAALLADVE
ncbi:MAG: phosphate acyltransferase [Candidatus Cloacimonadota bacterium]|nr:phosphate acyltransferase [Candidatus Cloacimonadota bacterium]